MYIIESVDIEQLIQEIINVESGELRYCDGVPEEPPYSTYPELCTKNMKIIPKSQKGYIYLPGTESEIIDIMFIVKQRLQNMDQDWLKRENINSKGSDFITVYQSSRTPVTSSTKRAGIRNIQFHFPKKICPNSGPRTLFNWHVLPIQRYWAQLWIGNLNPVDDLFSILCNDGSVKYNGFIPKTLTFNDLNMNMNFTRADNTLKYHPRVKFLPTICGEITHPYQHNDVAKGYDRLVTRVCSYCRKKAYGICYIDTRHAPICEICASFRDIKNLVIWYNLAGDINTLDKTISGYDWAYLKKDRNAPILFILKNHENMDLVESMIKHKGKVYHIVECGEYCCVGVKHLSELIHCEKFTDKKIVPMTYIDK